MLKLATLLGICLHTICGKEVSNEETLKEDLKENNALQIPPHIIFIMADDMGWNDVSFHGSPQIPTPNIDALAASGIILNSYYTENICTPSRASFMTGRYAIKTGLQHFNIKAGEATALPLDFKIMPNYLKNLGYSTNMIGKWHLGYFKKEYTPINRGFDSFFGIFNGRIDYFDYTNYESTELPDGIPPYYGIDLQEGAEVVKGFRGKYTTDVFSQRALKIIENHNNSTPLFLYLAHIAPHSANNYMPLEAPIRYVKEVNHIKDSKRRTFGGMVSALDLSVGKVVEALNKKGLLQNSIIVFSSDNGGLTRSSGQGQASNWPLRGQKLSSFEGGLRVPSLIFSPLLKLKKPRIATELMHVSDWLPTLYSAAGGDLIDLGEIDGVNMWDVFINDSPSPRIEVLHNIDPILGISALRRGDYKLLVGSVNNTIEYWSGPSGFEDIGIPPSMDEWVFKNNSIVKKVLEDSNLWLLDSSDNWRASAGLDCKGPLPRPGDDGCNPNVYPCLFNIPDDPCEYKNIANQYPRIVKSMMERLKVYNASALTPLTIPRDPHGHPRCHGFAYVPWKEEEYVSSCSLT